MKYIKKRLRLPLKEVSYIWTLITSPICSINQMWHQVDSFLPSNQYKITKAPFSIWVSPVRLCGPAVHNPPFNITLYSWWHECFGSLLAQGPWPQSQGQTPLVPNTMHLDGYFLKAKIRYRNKLVFLERSFICTLKLQKYTYLKYLCMLILRHSPILTYLTLDKNFRKSGSLLLGITLSSSL